MKNQKLKSLILLVIIALPGIFLIECNQSTTPVQQNDLQMSVFSTADTTDNIGILVITEAKILISDIKLNVANSGDSADFQVGPYVLYLNLSSSVQLITSSYVPFGTYDRMIFMIHKLNVNEPVPDPDFADANGRYSVVVKGTYNGIPFVYKSIKSAHQIIAFPTSVAIATSILTNITISVEPYRWFMNNGFYMDPSNPANINDIDNNIKDNINRIIKAFRDNDKDGRPD